VRAGVGVRAVVAGRGHEQLAGRTGGVDRVEEGLREAARRPTSCWSAARRPRSRTARRRSRRRRARSTAAQELDADDLGGPVDAGDADAVVAHAGDRAGAVRAVAVVVEGVAVVVVEVVAMHVVDITVGVVVDPVTRYFPGVGPNIGGQIRWL